MLTNYHTHTTFCDGKNTPEEVVISAIEKGFAALGFSSHGDSPRYGLKDPTEYIAEISRLKEKYKEKIQIYVGIEEDSTVYMEREKFDYLIGSKHYMCKDGKSYPIDSNFECFSECLKLFDGDAVRFADEYYSEYCWYIKERKPDIVAHFDLITKFDEKYDSLFFLDEKYLSLADKYMAEAAKNDVIFEVNTGAISRGVRTTPYPHERLLYTLKNCGGKVMINSDSHAADTLDCSFDAARELLCDVGFSHVYVLYDGEFRKVALTHLQ